MTKKIEKDSKYGWFVVASSFTMLFVQDGISNSLGQLLSSIEDHFNTGLTESQLYISLMYTFTYAPGPLIAILIKRTGHRTVAILGPLTAAFGFLLAGVSMKLLKTQEILSLYISGGLVGLGFGCMFLTALDVIEIYFDRKLGMASGIASSGSGIGGMVFAPIIFYVNEEVGLEYTMYVLGGVTAISVTTAFVFQNLNRKFIDEMQDSLGEDKERLKCLNSPWYEMVQDPVMLVVLASRLLYNMPQVVGLAFSADRIIQNGSEYGTSILSIMSIGNCLGRIIFGKVLDMFPTKTFTMITAIILINSAAVWASDYFPSFYGQAVYAAVFGSTYGAIITSSVLLIKKLFYTNITERLGMCLFMVSVASLLGPYLIGHLYDQYGDYSFGFRVVGGIGVVGSLLFAVLIPLSKRKGINHLVKHLKITTKIVNTK